MVRSLSTKIILFVLLLRTVSFAFIAVVNHQLVGIALPLWLQLTLTALAELLLGVCLFLFIYAVILRRLRPIAALTKAVASGDFNVSALRTDGRDELGTIAVSINEMTAKLRDLFEPYQAIISDNQYAMIVTDDRYVVTGFNTRAEEILGYRADEVIGRKLLLAWHDLDQLRERAKAYSTALGETITPDESVLFAYSRKGLERNLEWRWIAKDGRKRLVSINTSVMRHPDGSIKGYVKIARDISEMKQTAELNTRLLQITESAHDMIATFDLRGRIFYLNQAGLDFLGIKELNDSNNQLERYMTVPTTLRLVEGLRIALEQGYWRDESEWMTDGGTIRTTSQTIVAHPAGDEPFFSSIVRDISHRKEIERQLLLAKQAADEASEAKSSFLARMSHEIRTPLNGVIGLTHLLQRSSMTEVQKDYLRQIAVSSDSLLHILNDVLDYSKLEADKLMIEHVPFRLEDSLERLSATFAVLLGPKPIDLKIGSEPDVPDVLYGDPARLEQILLNLVSNAIKFTNEGYISLHIELLGSDGSRTTLRFSVSDTGIGLTHEQLTGLFQPFVQADDKTSRKFGGTGLGLVICRALVDRMGGEIRAHSRPQAGSTFEFELSFDSEDRLSRPDELVAGMRVLVHEDDSFMADHWKATLSAIGCETETAADWERTNELLAQVRWDALIVDMEAGDMHGEQTWEEWKRTADSLGVPILCSTTLRGRDALQSVPDPVKPDAVLVKPSVRQQIARTLRHVKERRMGGEFTSAQSHGTEAGMKGCVLIVEDNEINLVVAKAMIEAHGLLVKEAPHGAKALPMLEENTFDLILMDLHMPEMDGYETTRRIRADNRWQDIPIVAITADASQESRAKCLSAGMNDMLAKPIEPESLQRMLSHWLYAPPQPSDTALTEAVSDASWTWPDTNALDIPLALHRLDGKKQLYLQLLKRFREEYADLPDRLRTLLAESETDIPQRLLHSFRGAAGHLGAVPVAREALLLEEAVRKKHPSEAALAEFEERLLQLVETINYIVRQKEVRRNGAEKI